MSIRPFRDIKRRQTKVIDVGGVKVGGDNPISVQSMTNTLTTDINATIKQINEIHGEGADIVRVSCPDQESSKSLKEITKHVDVPIVADIHFHYKRAIEAAENGASCLRINPGNIGSKEKIKEVGGNMGQYASCLFYVYNSDGSKEEVLTFIDNYFVRRVYLPNVNKIYLGGFSSGCSNTKIEISYDYQQQQGLSTDSNGYYYVYNTYGDSDDFILPANFRVGMEGEGTCVLSLKDSQTHKTIEAIVKSTYRAGFTRVNIGKETKVFLSTEGVTLTCDDDVKLIFKP